MSRITRALLLLAFLLLAASVVIFALRLPLLAGLIAVARLYSGWRGRRGSGGYSHGTARAGTVFDMLRAGFLSGKDDGDSLIFGNSNYAEPPTLWQGFRALASPRVSSPTACRMMLAALWRRCNTGLVRIKHFTHLLTVAPAGAGKSIYALIPNLLSYRGSCVINDPSGELWKATAAFRQNVTGHRCYKLDPFGIAGPPEETDCLNPFDFVDANSPDFSEQVRDIADAIVLQRGDEREPHFNERALDLISGFVAFVCALEPDPKKRHLGVVRDILSSRGAYLEALQIMQETPEFHGVLSYYGHQLTWLVDRELGSVMSTVHRHLSWLQSPPVIQSLSRSTVDPRWLWTGKVDIYLVTPHDRLTTMAGLLRLQLSTIIRLLARTGDEKHQVLFMLDEIGHCGKIRLVEDAITLWRKAGIRIWLFVQSLDQLRMCYGDNVQKVIDNCGTQQYFGITSYDTADILSKRVGDFTQILESIGKNSGRSRPDKQSGPEASGSTTTGWSLTLSETARRLFKPEEILLLPADLALLFHRNWPVMPLQLVGFFRIPNVMKFGSGREKPPGLIAAMMAFAAVLLGGVTFLFVDNFQPPPLAPPRYAHHPSSARPTLIGPANGGMYGNGFSQPPARTRYGARRYGPRRPVMNGEFDLNLNQ